MSAPRLPLILPARSAVLVLCLSLFALAVIELIHIPIPAFRARPLLLPQAFVRLIAEAFLYCWVNLLSVGSLVFIQGAVDSGYSETAPRRLKALQALTAIIPAAFAYYLLQLYEPFALYPPFIVAFVGVAFLTWANFALPQHRYWQAWSKRCEPHGSGLLRRVLAAILLILAFLVTHFNYGSHKGLYPTLHLSALVITHLLVSLACYHIVKSFEAAKLSAGRAGARVLILLVLLAPILSAAGLVDGSGLYVTAYTATGQSKVVFHRFQSSDSGSRPHIAPDPEATDRFVTHSGLPKLPESLRLEDYNVLLVTSEATRFDRTSLAKGQYNTTPHLVRLREKGAFSFTRAYSPSSGTLHSISSVMAMTFPSALHLETYKKPWHGTLLNQRPIVPQLFKQAGYETFWIGHAYRNCFRNNIRGFHHGFEKIEYVVESKEEPSPTLDRDIVDASITALEETRQAERKFFGWVFLGGPHWPYVQHEEGSEPTEHERYLQEVREMDRQWGRLLDKLVETGLISNTIVIYFGDHGEEFGEHGGTHHKSTVYSEVLHVPLLVYVPGMDGQEINAPVSTYYAFPWLLRSGPPSMKQAANERIQQEIGPLLRATQGGVVAELIGHDRMLTSIIYRKHKYNYDFLSNLIEVYDLESDPGEQTNLFDTHMNLAEEAVKRISAYKTVRAARAHFTLLPDDPR